ncbi:MAG: hypothetical protein R2702_11655 [Acidimicrobiales bacterium]
MPDRPSASAPRRTGVLAALVGVVAIATVLVGCGRGSGDGGLDAATPGFDGNGRTVDTRPFDIPEADPGASTTLPPGVFDDQGPTATTETTLPPTTTTTLPLPDGTDPVCTALYRWSRLITIFVDGTGEPASFGPNATSTLDAMIVDLSSASDPAFAPAIALYQGVRDRIAAATTSQEVEAALLPVVTEKDPPIVDALAPLRSRVEASCPDLFAATTANA